MKLVNFHTGTALLGLGILLLCQPAGQAKDDPPAKGKTPDYTVKQDGPIHEAYATPRSRSREAPQQVNQEPPQDLNEEIPDQKPDEDNAQWIPGYWDTDGQNNFVWVSGCWRVPPPNQQWVAGYWQQVGKSWRRVPGFWTLLNAAGQGQGQVVDQSVSYYPQPPEPQEEDPGEDPTGESDWAPGSWTYSPGASDPWSWTAGQWVRRVAGWSWTGPSWSWTPGGYVWNRGYWDYSYGRRGWAYASIWGRRGWWNRPGFVYRPNQVISPLSLNNRTLVFNGNRYGLRGATITSINNLTGIRRVPVTPAQRANLLNHRKTFLGTAFTRRNLEGKNRHPGKGVVNHKVRLPRPRPTKNPNRLNPPARPTRNVVKRPTTGGVRRPGRRGAQAWYHSPSGQEARRPRCRQEAGDTSAGQEARRSQAGRSAEEARGRAQACPETECPARSPEAAGEEIGRARKSAARKPAAKRPAAKKPAARKAPAKRAGGARKGGGRRK